MKILITGSKGYIGSNLLSYFKGTSYSVHGINRDIIDLNDLSSLQYWIQDKFFDVVIHTAIKGGSRLKSDTSEVIDTNLKMYLNLLECRDHYSKFINIGSGAEIYHPFTPYGLSKRAILESLQDKTSFYSLRIFGLFDSKELDTRFIKSNLLRYIKQDSMIIHKDRLMDFIHFNDFISIINFYITNINMPKNLDCVYANKYLLSDICNIINTLSNYTVPVKILENNTVDSEYVGLYNSLGIEMSGLRSGISQTYQELLKIS